VGWKLNVSQPLSIVEEACSSAMMGLWRVTPRRDLPSSSLSESLVLTRRSWAFSVAVSLLLLLWEEGSRPHQQPFFPLLPAHNSPIKDSSVYATVTLTKQLLRQNPLLMSLSVHHNYIFNIHRTKY
jgi:hypothetical protein